jgi:DNA-directed RNA polymerase specialized sigma24 family protein
MYTPSTISDTLLVEMIKAKKREGAEALFDQYAKVLSLVLFRKTGNSAKTDDMLEKCFVTIWLTIDQYNEQANTSLLTWMIAVAKNTAAEMQMTEVITLKPLDLPYDDLSLNLSI